MGSPVLELRGIKKKYGPKVVLDGLDLQVESGQFYALLGRNGTGKSTLMRLLARHEDFDAGTGNIFGQDMTKDLACFNEQIGFVSESISYQLPSQNVRGILDLHRAIRPQWDENYVEEAVAVLKLPLNQSFANLSRGQKMQVALLTASAFWPRLMLLDEITSVLDAVARDYFLKKLREHVRRGALVVVATNIISEVQPYLDRVILLQEKKTKFNASLADLAERFVRIHRPAEAGAVIFPNQDCVEIGIGANGDIQYLATKESAAGLPPEFVSKVPPSASDVFLFLSRVRE